MGSCVSVHKHHDSSVKIRISLVAKARKFLTPSPKKEKTSNGKTPVENDFADCGFKSSPTYQNLGSKDETFFETQAWLDSDCEDDFLSVNGDFTPSQCSTPRYHGSPLLIPLKKGSLADKFPDTNSESSPSDKKKKLSELFKESIRSEVDTESSSPLENSTPVYPDFIDPKLEINKIDIHAQPPKSLTGTPYLSGQTSICSSERTPNRDEKRKSTKGAAQCCLPNLVQSLSFAERKKPLSPAVH